MSVGTWNWGIEHYNSVLEITVSFLGIHKWEPEFYIGFSPALHLQCMYTTYLCLVLAGIDGMIAWNLGAFLSFLLVLSTWAAEFNIRASVLLPIRHTVRTALL